MTIEASISKTEETILASLCAKQVGIDDPTGKGLATESVVERELLLPHMPPRFRCSKGAVVAADNPGEQSPAIDRVINDPSAAPPLIYDEAHSIFPIESVCGLVEITMRLDATKLRGDIERMASIKVMRTRRYVVPIPNSKTKAMRLPVESLSPRSYIIGVPADPKWTPKSIASAIRKIQQDLGPPTHVHGVYVIGIGFFETIPIESDSEPMYRVCGWTGPDRLFRFTSSFRQSLDRWPSLAPGWSVDLQGYAQGQCEILAE